MKAKQDDVIKEREKRIAQKKAEKEQKKKEELEAKKAEKELQKKQIRALSFLGDEEDDEDQEENDEQEDKDLNEPKIKKEEMEVEDEANSTDICIKEQSSDSDNDDDSKEPPSKIKKIIGKKNPDVDTSFLPDRDREEQENQLREQLRQVCRSCFISQLSLIICLEFLSFLFLSSIGMGSPTRETEK